MLSAPARLVLALFAVSLLPLSASGQVVCGKAKKNGIKWKLRDACKVDKGEIPVPVGGGEVHFTTSSEATNVPSSGEVPIVLADGPSTIFNFETSAESSSATITFSADCSVIAGVNDGGWLDIDIVLDGAGVPPTSGGANRFCALGDEVTSTTSGITTFTKSASITVAATGLQAGLHSITVPASMLGGPSGAIQRPSLVVVTYPE